MLFFSFVALNGTNIFYLPIACFLIMIVSDTLVSIVGKKFGKKKIIIKWNNTERKVIGSMTLFITAFILSYFSYFIFGYLIQINQVIINPFQVFLFSILTAFTATLIELLSPSTYDDLTVPILTTLIMFIFSTVLLV